MTNPPGSAAKLHDVEGDYGDHLVLTHGLDPKDVAGARDLDALHEAAHSGESAQSQGPQNATPNADKQARVDAALDKMRAIAAAEGMKMVRNADNTGWIFVGREVSE